MRTARFLYSLVIVLGMVALGAVMSSIIRVAINGPRVTPVREIPDVVIEQEAFRRFSLLPSELCTYCREPWRSCQCRMAKHPLMFQNREQQSKGTIAAELARYGIAPDKE